MSHTIKVKDVCGEYCIDENDVQNIYEDIVESLEKEEEIELDFEGVDTVLTAYFNSLIGELFKKYNFDFIKKYISFSDETPPRIIDKFSKSLENARRFYESSVEEQDKIKDRVSKIFRREIDINEPLPDSAS